MRPHMIKCPINIHGPISEGWYFELLLIYYKQTARMFSQEVAFMINDRKTNFILTENCFSLIIVSI